MIWAHVWSGHYKYNYSNDEGEYVLTVTVDELMIIHARILVKICWCDARGYATVKNNLATFRMRRRRESL